MMGILKPIYQTQKVVRFGIAALTCEYPPNETYSGSAAQILNCTPLSTSNVKAQYIKGGQFYGTFLGPRN